MKVCSAEFRTELSGERKRGMVCDMIASVIELKWLDGKVSEHLFIYWAIPATPSGCGPKSRTGSMRARCRTSLSLQSLQDSKPRAVEATRRMQTFLKSDGGRGSSQRVQLLPARDPAGRPGVGAGPLGPQVPLPRRCHWGHYCQAGKPDYPWPNAAPAPAAPSHGHEGSNGRSGCRISGSHARWQVVFRPTPLAVPVIG